MNTLLTSISPLYCQRDHYTADVTTVLLILLTHYYYPNPQSDNYKVIKKFIRTIFRGGFRYGCRCFAVTDHRLLYYSLFSNGHVSILPHSSLLFETRHDRERCFESACTLLSAHGAISTLRQKAFNSLKLVVEISQRNRFEKSETCTSSVLNKRPVI